MALYQTNQIQTDQPVAVSTRARPERIGLLEVVFGAGGVLQRGRWVHRRLRLVGRAHGTRRPLQQLQEFVFGRTEDGVDHFVHLPHPLFQRLLAFRTAGGQ